MASVNWNNNFNDNQAAGIIGATVAGSHSAAVATLSAHSADEYDAEWAGDVGHKNWRVGDQFTVAGTTTVYTLTGLTLDDDGLGKGNASFGFTPPLDEGKDDGDAITKEDSYKGNQGSVQNHIRLRNLGYI